MNYNNTLHSDIIKTIKNSKNIIIISHSNPDGDAIGSMLGLSHYINSKGIKVKNLLVDPVPSNMKFLNGSELIEKYSVEKHNSFFKKADLIILVDLNDITRVRELEKQVIESPAYKIVIDHHPNPKDFANLYYVNPDASSTGELIYNILISDSDYEIDKAVSEALYTAIVTDTGSFRFSNTTSKVHKIIAELIESGADPYELYDKIYNQSSPNIIKLLGLALTNIKMLFGGKVCIMQISESDFRKTNTSYRDTEFFVERTLSIQGVLIGILLTEVKERNEIKISLRSKREISVSNVASALGGGGHMNASGANIKNMSLADALDMVIRQLTKLNL